MQRARTVWLIIALFIATAGFPTSEETIRFGAPHRVYAADAIYPLNDVKPGMKGTIKTVFEGTAIEEFPCEVIGIMRNFFPQKDVIMVKLLGDKATFTGVVAGMSGSPMYIDGKVVGALAYRFASFQKEPIAGITPIEEMLPIPGKENLRDYEQPGPKQSAAALAAGMRWDSTPYWNELINALSRRGGVLTNGPGDTSGQATGVSPVPIGLSVSGLRSPLLQRLAPALEKAGFVLAAGGGGSADNEGAPLEPGAPISAVLLSGDLDFSATGTVTYRDGDKVLAFGHPFFEYGPINMPIAQASILHTLSTLSGSFKIANLGKIVGNLRQDRTTGIYGVVGEAAPMFPLTVTLKFPWGDTSVFHYQAAQDRTYSDIIPLLCAIAVDASLESARLSLAEAGSMKVKAKVAIKGKGAVEYEDFYGGSTLPIYGNDLASSRAIFDFMGLVGAILENGFINPELESADFSVEFVKGRNVLQIKRAWLGATEAKPGDMVPVFLAVKPFLKDETIITQTITIPKDAPEGPLTVFVGSGSAASLEDTLLEPPSVNSFDDTLALLRKSKQNNRLYLYLEAPSNGISIKGKTLSNLPPSVQAVLNTWRVPFDSSPLNRKLLAQTEAPMDADIRGRAILSITINREDE
ncbi:MAG: SpoIVB peptidase S55 domain-containing protein [bacterium]